MPSRNIIKAYAPESYYHVYVRGANKQKIFLEAADYNYFYKLLSRYLSVEHKVSTTGVAYPHFRNRIKLLSYCLMTNHFHLLVYQYDQVDLPAFMKSLMTSYSRYFNLKYKRTGPVFESRYKAVRIVNDQYLQHITRYIHLNPRRWKNYYNSSLKYYRDGDAPEWLDPNDILQMFTSKEEYMVFVSDYEAMRDMLAEMKYQIADA